MPPLAGCAADAGAPLATRALAAVGLVPAAAPALPAPARVAIELHAAPSLNAARDGVAVPTRVQLHWLREPASFLQAPYRRFDTASGDGVSEHVMLPGAPTRSGRDRAARGPRARPRRAVSLAGARALGATRSTCRTRSRSGSRCTSARSRLRKGP
ncbi:MAG: type VI secretion system lipoprotein TssJ [Comamonadaceae bacterium]|nr:type VI secretion system lipoprotein TssJ [Comamonadaceae bacterium]